MYIKTRPAGSSINPEYSESRMSFNDQQQLLQRELAEIAQALKLLNISATGLGAVEMRQLVTEELEAAIRRNDGLVEAMLQPIAARLAELAPATVH